MFTAEHAPPHDPQFDVSVASATSHPFAALPSQLAKPVLQTMPHVDPAQNGVPAVPSQTTPQAPQLRGLVATFVSQPSSLEPGWGPLQSAKPGLHV